MIAIANKAEAVKLICRRFGVQRLDLFGSAATDRFNERQSDLDFLVEFKAGTDFGPWMSNYFALRDSLARLYERSVDLVITSAIRDPKFVAEATKTQVKLYNGSTDNEVVS